jgi:beta-galactosidase
MPLTPESDTYLFAAEVHYFRFDPDRWAAALRDVQAAGMNAVSIYVPWNWHEWEPEVFDFAGASHPRRNLLGFLDLCGDVGLPVIFRPGPWILSEWQHGGIPDWLLRSNPEVLALDAANRPPDLEMLYPPVTYLHPLFLERARTWYRALVPILQSHRAQLIGFQIDDELHYGWGIRCGDPLFVDYNPVVVGSGSKPGLYQGWLADRYGEIARLNERYGARYDAFAEVQAPRTVPGSLTDLPRFMDWHYAKEAMANRFAEVLYDEIAEACAGMPISVLSPYMTPYGVRRFADYFAERKKPIRISGQCYPTLYGTGGFAEESAGHVAALIQLSRDWQSGTGHATISAESQSAMSFHLPPAALEVFYALQLGQGVDGMSLYMMVGGDNPAAFGMNTGSSYDVSAPIAADGAHRPHLEVIERTGRLLETHGERIHRTQPLVDLAVGYYGPYETASLQGDTLAMGSRQHYGDVLSQAFGLGTGAIARGGGIFSLLTAAGYSYAMVDLERASLDDVLQHRQLWCLGLDFMAEAVQRKLLAYVEGGGNLVLLPQVPTVDENFRPTTVLHGLLAPPVRTETSIRGGSFRTPWHLVTVDDVRGMPVPDTVDSFDISALPGAEPIAVDERRGGVCGYRVELGRGSATVLGFKPRYGWSAHDLHRRFIRTITSRVGITRWAAAEDGELLVAERAGAEGGYLFVVNATRWPAASRIRYWDPATRSEATMPIVAEHLSLPDQGGLVLPFNLPIPGSDAVIVHASSQVQSLDHRDGRYELTLYGAAGTPGEVALRCSDHASVSSPDVTVESTRVGELLVATYRHQTTEFKLVAKV